MGPDAEEDHPFLKRDEEFAKDVFAVFKDGNREKIREKVMDPNLSLALKCPESGVSLATKLLTQVTKTETRSSSRSWTIASRRPMTTPTTRIMESPLTTDIY